MSVNWNRGKKT